MSGGRLLVFVLRRLVVLAVLLVVISFVTFTLLEIAPGNLIDILLGSRPHTAATVRILTREYHLNEPFLVQYWLWARQAVLLHFGTSIQTSLPVASEIGSRLALTLFLGVYSFVLTMVLGIGFGVVAALKRGGAVDRILTGAVMLGLSTPAFVAAVALLYLFAIKVRWFPAYGTGSEFLGQLWHLTLPSVALAVTTVAYVSRHTRAAMIGVLDQDYVVFARARGLSSRRVLCTYLLRNALIPVITISGVIFSSLIVGVVLVEVAFSLPGLGSLLVTAATAKDITVLQAVVLLFAVVIVVANLLADVIYMVVDPRIRVGERST
ncbi:MAG TPA: ABC transporter permease [Streptosporangiaceae bacterium]|nr:ABC transporter permease [Streptosporangiaceae bacterium]